MSERNDGGPAFPPMHNPENHPSGLSKRDWFAGQALAGLCANMNVERFVEMSAGEMANLCFLYADNMLAESVK